MRMNCFICFLLIFIAQWLIAQPQTSSLNYFLPQTSYDSNVKSPGEFMGFEPGEWHMSHDQLVYYCKHLAEKSDRVIYSEYARSHENRPLFHLIISSSDHINNIDQLQDKHKKLAIPDESDKINIDNLPTVINLGYSVHGNEQSAVSAAVVVAYYLAAGQSKKVDSLLNANIVLLDPCLNPDGMNRFSSWVNMHKSKHPNANPASREHNEIWPGGRTNHYWFDLNRDWLPLIHPESQGRVKRFHEWYPNIVCDYHEMGTNSTYFFQPGIPSRNNPLTPDKTFELTESISNYHAKYLDQIGSLYYSKESFDDFYFGKGSTYPDINGAIGILFEQASSRGHVQESIFGDLTFAFTIRNQVATTLSSLDAAMTMNRTLNEWKKTFFTSALNEAKDHSVKAYIFKSGNDQSKVLHFLNTLELHAIDVYQTKSTINKNGIEYPAASYLVPLEQRQYRLIRSIFDTTTVFRDSIFYDVSSWTLPLGMNISYDKITNKSELVNLQGGKFEIGTIVRRPQKVERANYAYIIEYNDYFAPALLNQLLMEDIRVQFTQAAFSMAYDGVNTKTFQPGTLIIPVKIQDISEVELNDKLQHMTSTYGIPVYSMNSGNSKDGIMLGSPKINMIKKPKMVLLIGQGISYSESGEVWHLFDQKFSTDISLVDINQFNRINWNATTHLFLVSGNPDLSDREIKSLENWIRDGGTIIAINGASQWLANKDFINLKKASINESDDEKTPGYIVPYEEYAYQRGANWISGAIFSMDIDKTHPLFYGYETDILPVFRRGTNFYEPTENSYATPARYSEDALLSGYVPNKIKSKLSGHAGVTVHRMSSGRVICFHDNPLFRGYWLGGHRAIMNAIYFSNGISSGTMSRD